MTTPPDLSTLKMGAKPRIDDPRTVQAAPLFKQFDAPSVYDFEWYVGYPALTYDTGNTRYGNCTIASCYEIQRRYERRETGHYFETDAQTIIDFYLQQTGGEDKGWYTLEALKLWRTHGLPSGRPDVPPYRINWFAAVNPHYPMEIKQAIYTFGCVVVTAGLPTGWMQALSWNPEQPGVLGKDAGPIGSAGWHQFFADLYTEEGMYGSFATWHAGRQFIPWEAVGRYVTEIYAVNDAGNSERLRYALDMERVAAVFKPLGVRV